jgi:hypothetical protein
VTAKAEILYPWPPPRARPKVAYHGCVEAILKDRPAAHTEGSRGDRTLAVGESLYESVLTLAHRDGIFLEEEATSLLREGVKARARAEGKAILADLPARSARAPSDEDAMTIAVDEQRAMRAERRTSGSL